MLASEKHVLTAAEGRVHVEADGVPAHLSLIEGMNDLVAVECILRVVCRAIVHRRLHHVETELAVLLQLQVLKRGLLKEQSDDHGRTLDFRSDALEVGSGLLETVQ